MPNRNLVQISTKIRIIICIYQKKAVPLRRKLKTIVPVRDKNFKIGRYELH